MKIEDNFLDQEKFEELQSLILGQSFTWFYNSKIDFMFELSDKYQFTHYFYSETDPVDEVNYVHRLIMSTYFEILNPILEILNPISLWRIKANLLTKTLDIVKNQFHIDNGYLSEEKSKQWTTSIFYMNTNNGYTEFEDGTKVESVANRMITFPADLKHRGTSCTDEKTRVVINFNYFGSK